MLSFFAKKVGDVYMPTTAGYTAIVALLIVLFLVIGFIRGESKRNVPISAKQITFSALAVALALVASYLKIFKMPMGGSITLFSMLFITLIGYWYGVGAGVIAGAAYGLLQMMIDPYIISLPQLFVDYILAFAALGLSGITRKIKYGLQIGYVIGVLGRFVFAVLSGLIFFASAAPDSMGPLLYSVSYNGTYLGAEAVLTFILISIPAVKKALEHVKKLANS